ncbi:putative leucine-rich repeat-containing, plant-type, leucine-rich repeat domain superfamily [Helianthus annuus]|nr:putative leucine-rich repeat-containing, plant-type, leucine-rich repeat domain superfamily [Helianthus annuus]
MPRSIHVFFLILVLHVLKSALANKFSSFSHADECSLLFQFKESMSINKSASGDSRAYPKVSSWNLNSSDGEKSCCLWDGVECRFGHVIGLELSSSFLYGPIYSNNSLFNLIHLRTLNLADNDFDSSQIPSEIGRLSQLANLDLSYSGLSGEVPKQISHLRNLVSLDLSSTYRLKMQSSDIQNLVQNSSETLRELFLSSVNINSDLPASIGNLTHLNILDLDGCGFTGTLPASVSNLTQLTHLSLGGNNFDRWKLPDWFGKLNKITQLDLHDVNLYGEIPSSFFNLTQVESLDLSINQLKGELSSSWLNFQNLESFYLDDNNVTANLYLFLSLKKLKTLDLSGNNITLSVIVIDSHKNGTQPQFIFIRLESCNLKVFPEFLRFQHQLEKLILDYNNIEGLIPGWMWNISTETLTELTLSHNLLMGFEQHSPVAPWVRLQTLDLSHNMLHGEILMPPPTTEYFSVSNNNLTGGIPPSICDLLSLQLLDLSFNNIIGSIPPCLEKLSNSSLTVLNLRGNTLHGTIPNIFANGSMLQFIDLSENILKGQVPRSLEDCKSLRFLDLGYNFIEDLFPSWLGVLSELQVFILRFNKFHGIIRIPSKIKVNFPALGIIDLSYNSFYGDLPHQYFLEWLAMKETKANANYMETYVDVAEIYRPISFSVQMTSKGVKLEYVKILNAFFAVDFSSNMFSGKIPESVKTLTGLQLLNLSNNELSGVIPPSMGNLIRREALDLSSNKLSGMIPQDLVQLNFLAFLNVSNNNLTGPIPQGKQFNTFSNDSYMGNALCGFPLSKKCGDLEASKPPKASFEEDTESNFPNGIDWVVILVGAVTGLVIGLVCGDYLSTKYYKWFSQRSRR